MSDRQRSLPSDGRRIRYTMAARRAVELGTTAYDHIVKRWGQAVLAPDGHLDRAALRRVVFADHDQLEELNQTVHPEVERLRARLVDQARKRGDRIVVCDIPLLFLLPERIDAEAFRAAADRARVLEPYGSDDARRLVNGALVGH